MIRLEFLEEVYNKHRLMCPYCRCIIDLLSKIQLNRMPGGISFSIDLYGDKSNKFLEKSAEKLEFDILKIPKEIEESYKELIYEG